MTKHAPTLQTEAFVQKVQFKDKLSVIRDTKVTGLMLVMNKRSKSYKIQRDLWTGHRGRRRLVKTVRYTLGTTDDLVDRLVIDWGGAALSWHQWYDAKPKEVVEILPRGYIGNFPGLLDLVLDFGELQKLTRNPEANRDWKHHLSAANGIYLIPETILLISVRGKRGVGYCKSTANTVRPFERLRERLRIDSGGHLKDIAAAGADQSPGTPWHTPRPTDLVFPADHKKQFNAILAENNLKFDREGNRRTAYSLRHTYICFRLLEGADIYQVAKNCRTSVEMIEKYYASHIATTLDASAINVRRPRVVKTGNEG